VVANTRKLRAIAEAKVKTDKVDARTLCELLDAGFLPAVLEPRRVDARAAAAPRAPLAAGALEDAG
jgi:transposase